MKALWFGVPCPTGLSLDIKPETGTDGWFKRFGISKEFQTGLASVDEAVYIVAEDPRLEVLFRTDRNAAQLLMRLLLLSGSNTFASRLQCVEGQLSLKFKVDGPLDERRALAQRAVPLMLELAAALEAASLGTREDASRPFASKALILLSINVALASCAVAYWLTMRQMAVRPAFIDPGWVWGLLFGGVLLVALVLLAWRWLGRSSRAHLVIMEIMLVGAVSYAWPGHFIAREINGIGAISGPVEVQRIESYEVGRHGSRRRLGTPYVRFFDDTGGAGWVNLTISRDLRESLRDRPALEIEVRRGPLGARMVHAVRVAPEADAR